MRKNMNKYAEVIVTYNRKKLLKENIEALLNQTFKDHDILIVDNNSNDGTKEMVAEIQDKRIKYYNTEKNLGGAGGFAFGLRKAIELGYLYAWMHTLIISWVRWNTVLLDLRQKLWISQISRAMPQ